MSSDLPQQSVPIIIKGGNKKASSRIQINSLSLFQITQEFQSQSSEWLQSSSDFQLSYVESVNLVSQTGDDQFCQTSTMSHPLTYAFKNDQNENIFIIRENKIPTQKNYTLSIEVQYPNSYFQIEQQSFENATNGNNWAESIFNSGLSVMEVTKVEVTDSNGIPVCQLLRSEDEEISLSIEPPV